MSVNIKRLNPVEYDLIDPVEVSKVNENINVNLNLDAFQRLRVSEPYTQYEYNFQYNKAPLIWAEKIAGSGTSTHNANCNCVTISTGITRTANQVKLVGYGDATNGIFFGQDDTGLFFILRSSASGSIVERKVYQSSWNIEKLDSSSTVTNIDITKTQIFVIDLQWLGVGRVRCGFEYNGLLYWCHEYYNTNILTIVYMTSANLPLHYSITDGSSSVIRQTFQYFRYRPGKSMQIISTFNFYSKTTNYIDQICATIITETGNDQETYYQHTANRGVTPKTATTTRQAMISIRPKTTYNSIVNRGQIIHEAIDLTVTGSGNILWELIYNPVLTGASFISAGNNAIFDYDISATTLDITNAEIITSGYASSSATSKQTISSQISAKYPLTLDIDGLNPKVLTLAVTALSGTVDCIGSMTAREYY